MKRRGRGSGSERSRYLPAGAALQLRPAPQRRRRLAPRDAVIYALAQNAPRTEGDTFIAPTAVVVGAVVLRHEASVWWGAVLRGDYDAITVGARSNIQDNCVVHVDQGYPVTLGDRVTIGHQATLHGCTIGDNSLVGVNSVVMNEVLIGENCIIGANTLLTEGTNIPPRSLIVGSPGRVLRELTDQEVKNITGFSDRYVRNFRRYQGALAKLG